MSTYGDATGLVLVVPSAGEPGKLLGLLNGELQAYFDSDGSVRAGVDAVALNRFGIMLDSEASSVNGRSIFWLADTTASPFGQTKELTIGTVLELGTVMGASIEANGSLSLTSATSTIALAVPTGEQIFLDGIVNGYGNRYTNLGDAIADTDALNRQTGDARYLVAASETVAGNVELATVGEAAAGTDTARVPTAAGLPLRVVGSGWALKQTDGSAPGGDNRGAGAVDLQTTRSASTQVASGAYAVVGGGSDNTAVKPHCVVAGGGSNTATGTFVGNAYSTVGGGYGNTAGAATIGNQYATVAGGGNNTASGAFSTICGGVSNTASGRNAAIAGGYLAVASKYGQQAHAAGSFAAQGDAQRSVYVARIGTTDATPTVLMLDGTDDVLAIADDTVWNFRAEIVAMTADAAKYAAYTVTGLVRRANGTVTVHGVATTTIAESDAGWDVTAVADDTNKALSITVTGAAATTIRWVASVYTTEVSFPGA